MAQFVRKYPESEYSKKPDIYNPTFLNAKLLLVSETTVFT
jgi:hypothetical protein